MTAALSFEVLSRDRDRSRGGSLGAQIRARHAERAVDRNQNLLELSATLAERDPDLRVLGLLEDQGKQEGEHDFVAFCASDAEPVREIMAALPEVEEFVSHGLPTFRVRGRKVFATYTINHHGDGRVALNLMAPPGAQAAFVKMRPQVYFVPPYVGPGGWLGIELTQGLRGK